MVNRKVLISELLPCSLAVSAITSFSGNLETAFKVHLTPKTNFVLFERSLNMMKDGVNLFFILIFVLELLGFFL